MREFWRVIGACSIVMFFYYAIVFVSYFLSRDPAPALALEKYSLMVALREYQKEQTVYPILPDSPIGDVKKQLIDGGYLPPGPDADNDARYHSLYGTSYGLLFHVNRTPANPRGTPCLIEFDAITTGWWGQPPKCPF
jgi:hypothetical protein